MTAKYKSLLDISGWGGWWSERGYIVLIYGNRLLFLNMVPLKNIGMYKNTCWYYQYSRKFCKYDIFLRLFDICDFSAIVTDLAHVSVSRDWVMYMNNYT